MPNSKTLPPNMNPKFVLENFSSFDDSDDWKMKSGENLFSGGSQFLGLPERTLDYNSDDGLV